jgi:hypothetical protein
MALMNLPPRPAAVAGPVLETRSSPRLKILSAHANPGSKDLAGGHLDVDAYAPTGALIAHRTTRWNGLLNGGRGSHPAGYAVRLDVAASDVAQVVVSHHPGDHQATEAAR